MLSIEAQCSEWELEIINRLTAEAVITVKKTRQTMVK